MDTRILCLAVLHRGPASGYEIKKEVEEGGFSHFQRASFGSIYPALTQLARDGLVTVTEEAQSGRPDKKVYRLTPAGESTLRKALDIDPGRDVRRSDFLFLLHFVRMLPAERVAKLVDDRIAWYRRSLEQFEDVRARCENPHEMFCLDFGCTTYRAAAEFLVANRDRIIAAAAPRSSLAAD